MKTGTVVLIALGVVGAGVALYAMEKRGTSKTNPLTAPNRGAGATGASGDPVGQIIAMSPSIISSIGDLFKSPTPATPKPGAGPTAPPSQLYNDPTDIYGWSGLKA